MPYRRKNSCMWWASLTGPDGQRIRRSTGTTKRAEAAALEAKWRLETYRQQQWEVPQTRTFDELILAYLKATQADKRSAETDRKRVRNLRPVFGGVVLNTLQASDIRDYICQRKSQGVSNATINREIALFSAAINYANREWDWEIPNVAKGRRLKEAEGRVRWLTRAEANALECTAEQEPKAPHLPDFIRLSLNTGCRAGELLGLEWRRVDFQTKLIILEPENTKAGRRRAVPMNRTALETMVKRLQYRDQHCASSPWVFCKEDGSRIQSVKRSFRTACRRAGIDDFRIHDMRHTCAAWLVSDGVPLAEVRDLLGHSTVIMTERYAHLSPENVRAAVARLDGTMSHFGHSEVTNQRNEVSENSPNYLN